MPTLNTVQVTWVDDKRDADLSKNRKNRSACKKWYEVAKSGNVSPHQLTVGGHADSRLTG